jgi:L-rhamnose-H+ transport protein
VTGETLEGLGLTLLAGVMSGNCMLPFKLARRWRFENIWFIFSIVSLVVLPWALAIASVRGLPEIYRSLPLTAFAAPLLWGAGWGVAQILFGISVRRLGLGLGYAIIVGLGAVLGTVVPLFLGQRGLPGVMALSEILAGVTMMILGVGLTAWGGKLRDRALQAKTISELPRRSYLASILLAIVCGLMAPMLNYAFAFGQALAVHALRWGNAPIRAAYAIWPIALLGGSVPNLLYSLYLLRREKTWPIFRERPTDAVWPTLMALLWMGAFALYGMSSVLLGSLGTSVGWGLFQIFMIMTATASGLLTDEWSDAPRRSLALLAAGLCLLCGATCLLSIGSS